jgi:iron complex outermembrane recepter protein
VPAVAKILTLFVLMFGLGVATFAQEFRTQSRRYSQEADTLESSGGDITAKLIRGRVRSIAGEVLPVASIVQLNTTNGTLADIYGYFSIIVDLTKPVKLICTYLGCIPDTIDLNQNSTFVNFKLKENYVIVRDVVVSASRKNERRFESPVTIETLSAKDLQLNPSLNLYDRMENMAGVDVITTSFTFKTLNTRGFNASYNARFVQRYDDVDLSMPGFNLSLGVLNGPVDIDVERAELIPGANSALYGANAINGLLNSTSKNPFVYQGLSANIKTGINHVDGVDHAPSPLYDVSFRYAQLLTKKLAVKVVVGYLQAADWHATDYRDVQDYRYSDNLTVYGYDKGKGNPGYDGVSIGGDEVATIFDTSYKAIGTLPFLPKGSLKVARTGYQEDQLFKYKPYSLKADIGVYYRPKKNLEISFTSRFSRGSSNFQIANRAQIENFFLQSHKVEVKGKRYALRAYLSTENIGQVADFSLASININRTAKSDDNWFLQYLLAYSGYYNAFAQAVGEPTRIEAENDAAARKFADSDNSRLYPAIRMIDTTLANYILGGARYQPGTAAFDSVYAVVKSRTFQNGGSSLKSTSKKWFAEYVYDLSDFVRPISLQAGVNYRLHTPQSDGTVFYDTTKQIYASEVGAFAQASKSFFDDRLRFQGSGRMDVLQRFDPKFSPRLSLVYLAGKKRQHSFRASAQIGYRLPTILNQFGYIAIPGAVTLGGFLNEAQALNLAHTLDNGAVIANAYTFASVNEYLYTGDSTKLIRPAMRNIKPEELRTVEFGWRTFLFERLETDISLYYSSFRNMINSLQLIGPANRNDTVTAEYVKKPENRLVYRRDVNLSFPLNSYGSTVSANYYATRKWTYYANYNYNALINAQSIFNDYVTGFNTPKHKVNIGIKGLHFWKNLDFNTNFHWVDSYLFQEFNRVGKVNAYYTLDMMVAYTFKQTSTMVKLGGSNITNNRYIQALGSPTIGAMFYISILYDPILGIK